MRRSRIRPGIAVPLLAAASTFIAKPAGAQSRADYVSPGFLFSFDLKRNQAFGLGAEFSFNRFPNRNSSEGFGGFANAVYYFKPEYARFALGGQADVATFGVEAGWAYNTAPLEAYGAGASTGPMLGAFGSFGAVMLAIRGTLPTLGGGPGTLTLDIGLKAPVLVGGRPLDVDLGIGSSGRPHRIDGHVVVADAVAGAECAIDPEFLSTLGRSERRALGRLWLEDARLEHSAVSAFLALGAELAALGAPPSLVRRAIDAARDEAVHTRLCLDGARRHTGLAWTLPAVRPPEPPHRSIATLVRESWHDGCLGEGIAARAAREGASRSSAAWTRTALERIARDESTHADLAWRVVEWCVTLPGPAGDEARAALADELGRTSGFSTALLPELPKRTLAAHGRVSATMMAAIAEQELTASHRLARSMLTRRVG
jgi:hypothetical protein